MRECTICRSSSLSAIQRDLQKRGPGNSFADIAKRYGVGIGSVKRHWTHHMPTLPEPRMRPMELVPPRRKNGKRRRRPSGINARGVARAGASPSPEPVPPPTAAPAAPETVTAPSEAAPSLIPAVEKAESLEPAGSASPVERGRNGMGRMRPFPHGGNMRSKLDWVLEEMRALATVSIDDFYTWDEDGRRRVRTSEEIRASGIGRAVKTLKVGKDGQVEFVLYDKASILRTLLAYAGGVTERQEHVFRLAMVDPRTGLDASLVPPPVRALKSANASPAPVSDAVIDGEVIDG